MSPIDDGRSQVQGNEHGEVAELLPWYVNETLEADQVARVDAHLAGCAQCRDDLAACLQFEAAVLDGEGWEPPPGQLERLKTRIAIEAPRGVGEPEPTSWLSTVMAWLTGSTVSPRWVLALQAAAMVVLAILVIQAPGSDRGSAEYDALTSTAVGEASGVDRIDLAFASDVSERDLRGVLSSVGGSIVSGPNALGVYRVEVTAGSMRAALGRLREDARVALATPASATRPRVDGSRE